ncbi:hypothetical protein D3C78_1616830 [compost metagenome]
MFGTAVGGGDQARGDLRVAAELLLQLAQARLAGLQAAGHGVAQVAEQRRALAGFADVIQVLLEIADQQCRRVGRGRPRALQQALQALAQQFGIERFGQVGGGRQRQGGAHAAGIGMPADQDERQCRGARMAAYLA